jgi:bifunctional aspartokinase / homoserine dehydrogenase 1
MKVLKFGGSSLGSPELIRRVAGIVRTAGKREKVIAVVSAFYKVTDQLIDTARAAERGEEACTGKLSAIRERHERDCAALFGKRIPADLSRYIDESFTDLNDILHGIFLLRDCQPRALDLVMSFGERLSAYTLAAYLNRKQPAHFVDARTIIRTDERHNNANVLFEPTERLIRRTIKKIYSENGRNVIPVVTGFIGSTSEGKTTTIGRNGSDFTASIIGAALNASSIEIWTNVDGVLSADPNAVKKAFVLRHLSYEEAMELSYFGSTVLHPATISPAVRAGIPIRIKNTLRPEVQGTLVSRQVENWHKAAKGVSSVDSVTLITVRGMSMVGVPGTAERLFRALASRGVNVVLISQSSSEHTICFAVDSSDTRVAQHAIAHEFRYEFQNRLTAIDLRDNQTIIAVVGQGMKGTPGVAGKIFGALGENNINVSAIAQGASELNISLVVDAAQKVRALNVIHQSFFEQRKRLGLVVIGTGTIGAALLEQIRQQRSFFEKEGFDVRVRCIANSKRYLFSSDGIDLETWRDDLAASDARMNTGDIVRRCEEFECTHTAVVDCTASREIVNAYPLFIRANMHIITPNKLANVQPYRRYQKLMALLDERKRKFLYEANIGAGLPIISTLNDLIASGDRVEKIEGIFSGTLSYLFNRYTGEQPFSELVREAHERGYTEPDPREDLSGQDVARKLLILARLLGLKMELKDIRVESLVPRTIRRAPFSDSFFADYAQYDRKMELRYAAARKKDRVLRYVATLDGTKAYAGLQEILHGHPFAALKGSDNSIAFTTQRYTDSPLVVQGPGAGADVTAMGVFSDILKLLHAIPY